MRGRSLLYRTKDGAEAGYGPLPVIFVAHYSGYQNVDSGLYITCYLLFFLL